MKRDTIQPALLTRTEVKWLQGKLEISNGYNLKIKSEIKRKLRIYNELEFPLLLKSGLIDATSNCNVVTANCNTNCTINSSSIENCAQNMVGREGFEPSNPAMSRRYLNQARPPAPYTKAAQKFCATNS